MATPRTATLSGTANWSNGNPFDGYVLVGVVLPSNYPNAAPAGNWPDVDLPKWVKVPVTAGAFNQGVKLYYNADLEPPNCRYCTYWYDTQDTLISGPSAIFDVTTAAHAITVPSLTAPVASVTPPTPPTAPA